MAGIFGFSSKKSDEKKPSGGDAVNAATSGASERSTSSGDTAKPSTDQPSNDRNSSMRLSKNTPVKTAESEFEIPSDPIVPQYNNSSLMSKSAQTNSRTPSAVIGPKIVFKGELSGEEDLLIHGTVEGTIDLKEHQLIVGAQGVVKANLKAKVIIIEGTVEGDLFGQERIEIKASSNVKGNLVADRVTLEDGAQFRGTIDMDNKGKGFNDKPAAALPSNNTPKPEKSDKA